MGLAASQSRYLFLTARKADCEYNISINSMRKMQYTREMSQLSQEYNSRLSQKKVAFYENGQYNKINYQYLMGYGKNYFTTFNGSKPLKENPSMILADYKGQVVLSDAYANAIMNVFGTSMMNAYGQGTTFSEDKIPEILANLCPPLTADQFRSGVESHEWSATTVNALTGDETGSTIVDTADSYNDKIDSILKFYYPIFQAAAANGWTTEYNEQIESNDDYISDAITSGTFQFESVNDYGQYDENTSLTYFVTSGDIELRNDSDAREELTAWYNAEKERISEEETMIDLTIEDLSTELEAIKTEMQSVQSFIQDATQVFNWCANG